MVTYTVEDLQQLISKSLANPQFDNVVCCYNKQRKMVHTFIRLQEDSNFEIPWRGGITKLKKGDYIHACLTDMYGITAEEFNNCYIVIKGRQFLTMAFLYI